MEVDFSRVYVQLIHLVSRNRGLTATQYLCELIDADLAQSETHDVSLASRMREAVAIQDALATIECDVVKELFAWRQILGGKR